jgi:glycerophosphoryl diester phosphodiesterase
MEAVSYIPGMRIFLFFCTLASLMAADAPRHILVHGHRGARAMRPENTLPAFQYAIGVGVDFLELDMAVTKDNVLVVSHDPILQGPVCKGPKATAVIHELTLAQVREWECGVGNPNFPKQQAIPGTRVPTLEQVFDLAPNNKVQFNIETKIFADHPEYTPSPEEFCKLVLAAVRKHHLESRVILQSFDFRTLHAMKKMDPGMRLSALYTGPLRDFVDIAREAGAGIVSPEYHLVTPDQVKAAHAAGLEVVPWTSNKPEEWDRLIAAGVDAIISDDPAALIAHLGYK